MHDIKAIRENPEAFDAGLGKRGIAPQAQLALKMDEAKRRSETDFQTLQNQRNQLAKQIGQAKGRNEDATGLMQQADLVKKNIEALSLETQTEERDLKSLMESLPNVPADDVPQGKDEAGNVELRRVGDKPQLAFKPKLHDELGEALGLMDFTGAAKISGARFVVLKGALARMERALASFFLDAHTQENGYTEMAPPFLVRDDAAYGTGQLPKFAEDLFKTTNGFWLIPTAEVPLTNLALDTIYKEEELPLRYTAYTPCFRSEAGAAGRDTRGMIRQHQFSKVEMVSIVHPDQSKDEHERMTACAERLLQKLGLAYRVMLLCSGDMGFCAEKTCDIEVWMPGQNDGQGAYREISSCSNCGPFQARRMKARFKRDGGKGTEFVHTLNGSGLPIGRTMVAILENYQQEDGSIVIPEALRPYMGGLDRIAR